MEEETQKEVHKFDAFEIIYLIYLALLPAAGTVFLLEKIILPEWSRFFVFIGGVAAVGLYLATIVSFSIIPASWWKRLIFMLDGPFIAVGLAYYLSGNIIDILMNMFFIDVGGAVLGIFITVIRKAPSKEDCIKGMIASGIPFLMMLTALLLYSFKSSEFSILQLGILLAGLLQTGFMQSRLFQQQNVVREFMQIIILGIVVWVAAYIFGCVFWDLRRKKDSGVTSQESAKEEHSTSNGKRK